jgi:predicted Zn-dependent peptidase
VNQETTDWQVWAVVQAVILGGDWHLIETFPDRVRAVRAEDIQRVAKKWLVNPQTAIVGDPEKLDPKTVGVDANSVRVIGK